MTQAIELSIFADESGDPGTESSYYLLTLVLHNQAEDLSIPIQRYKATLFDKRLPDIPFHASPLLNGHGEYSPYTIQERMRLLSSFFAMLRRLPIRCHTFAYAKRDFTSPVQLQAQLRRDLTSFLFDHLDYFQAFRYTKIYYDSGQSLITGALHSAIEYVLSKEALQYRYAEPSHYTLSQVADLICTLELTAIKYREHTETTTDRLIFGTQRELRKNYLQRYAKLRME